MVTVVNNPGGTDRVIEVDKSDSAAGWAVAVIILIAIVAVGAYAWTHYYRSPAAAQPSGGTNINVTVPAAGYAPAPSADTTNGGNATQAPANPAQ